MRGPINLLLVMLAVFYAGAARAVIIEVLRPAGGVINPNSEISLDIVLDTEGVAIDYYAIRVDFDPTVLGPEPFQTPPDGMEGITPDPFYGYGVLITGAFAGSSASVVVNQVVMQLVTEVLNVPYGTITNVTPYLDPSVELGIRLPGDIWLDPADITLSGLELQVVPEPATALLLACGLVALAMKRRRAA